MTATATLRNAKNPLALYKQIFDAYETTPREASKRSIQEQHARHEREIIAQRACH